MSKNSLLLLVLALLTETALILFFTDNTGMGFFTTIVAGLFVVLTLEPNTSAEVADKPSVVDAVSNQTIQPVEETIQPVVETIQPVIETISIENTREQELLKEIEDLTKIINTRTREVEILSAKLKDRRDIKILQRLGQFQAMLDFNRSQMANGKMTKEETIKEVEYELEAAMEEIGISIYEISIGTIVRSLPAESYELIDGIDAPSTELAGRVHRVRQRALVYKDTSGNSTFLIPAKIDAYKIN